MTALAFHHSTSLKPGVKDQDDVSFEIFTNTRSARAAGNLVPTALLTYLNWLVNNPWINSV